MALVLPYSHLNLTRNPFGELTVDELLRLAIVDADQWLDWLSKSPDSILMFVGEQGRGKTTSLRALTHAAGWDYLYVAEGASTLVLPSRPCGADEVQRLSKRSRRICFANRNLRAIASHEDHEAELRAVGRSTHSVHLPLAWSADRLLRIVSRRIQAFQRTDAPVPWLTEEFAEQLLRHHGSHIRQMINVLYDSVQSMTAVGPLPIPVPIKSPSGKA